MSIRTIVKAMGVALVLVLGVGVPAGFGVMSYLGERAKLQHAAEKTADTIEHHIYKTPVLWMYQTERLEGLLTQDNVIHDNLERELLVDGEVIVAAHASGPAHTHGDLAGGAYLPWPVVAVNAPVYMQKEAVAEVRASGSIRPMAVNLALVWLGFALLAAVSYRSLAVTPLALLDRTMDSLRDAAERARAADIAKSEFLATMSHEIRTPLNGVLGMAELLESTELDDRQKMFTEIVRSSGQALLGVINDILDFSKIDAGRLEIDPQPFELEVLASESARLIGRAAEAKGLDLLVRLQPGLPSAVIGDLGRIRQVITNLLSNAVKFTQQGQIVVDLSGAERSAADGARLLDLRVEVRDTGHGIAPDRIAKMFERFTQADSSHTRMQEGTGLGLAISKGLIELMGGQIGAVSQLNQGSTFWFTLSLPVDGAGERALGMSSEVEGRRVLVIDGNETNLRFLQEQLAAWRLVTAAASSGSAGLHRLLAAARGNARFDLVVLDQGLPDMTGEEFLRTLRAGPAGAATPAIILTSMSAERESTALTQPGGLQYVIKPPLASVLFDAIAVALAGRSALAAADRGPVAADTTNPQLQRPGAKSVERLHRVARSGQGRRDDANGMQCRAPCAVTDLLAAA
ncbi:MAG TPA: ATP-binding protein, partial [Thermohalobaculum sp.]|nr:ATP-binding protein [Thermohalobaculum sp.]